MIIASVITNSTSRGERLGDKQISLALLIKNDGARGGAEGGAEGEKGVKTSARISVHR